MKILVADSNFPDLCKQIIAVARLFPKDEVLCSIEPEAALEFSRSHELGLIVIAPDFPDDLEEKIRVISPGTKIVLTSKPFSSDELVSKVKALIPPRKRLYIQTFGGFNIFCDGRPLTFKRTKAKELLATLVDRRGSPVYTEEGCALLFEGKPYNATQKSYYRILAAELLRVLQIEGIDDIIIKTHDCMSVDIKAFECDAYQYLRGDPEAMAKYNGDYMSCYKWAEYSSALFAQAKHDEIPAQEEPAKPKRKRAKRKKASSAKK